MRTIIIVVMTPLIELLARISKAEEDLAVQAFITQPAVELS